MIWSNHSYVWFVNLHARIVRTNLYTKKVTHSIKSLLFWHDCFKFQIFILLVLKIMNEIRCLSPSESQQTNRFYAKTIPIPTSVIVLSSWVVCRVSGLSSRSVRFLIGLEKSGYSIWISIPFRTELCPLIFESCPWLVNQLLYPPKTYHFVFHTKSMFLSLPKVLLS